MITQNLYLGADLSPILSASTPEHLMAALERGLVQLEESDPRGRVAAVARLVAGADPDLVLLQEASTWWRRETLLVDYPALLLELLGGRYELAARRAGPRSTVPTADGGRTLEVGDAILVRRGMQVVASHGDFTAVLKVETPLLGPISLARGWAAVDAEVGGRSVRVIGTHLERAEPGLPAAYAVQEAQAAELIAGPGAAAAVILAGDFNSDARGVGSTATRSYDVLLAAGFQDAWEALHRGDPGFTWRKGDEIVRKDAELGERIDLVLLRGPLRALAVERLGGKLGDRTESGRWPSDHLALLATVALD